MFEPESTRLFRSPSPETQNIDWLYDIVALMAAAVAALYFLFSFYASILPDLHGMRTNHVDWDIWETPSVHPIRGNPL